LARSLVTAGTRLALWARTLTPPFYRPIFYGRSLLSLFRGGFRLRCFQPLSAGAWLHGAALSDNRYTSGSKAPFLSY